MKGVAETVLPDGSLPLPATARVRNDRGRDVVTFPTASNYEDRGTGATTAGLALHLANIVFLLSMIRMLMADAKLMRETQRLLVDKGAVARNMFAHTPTGLPHRSSLGATCTT